MSKDFDTTLSDALDLAAATAHPAGPSAARIRGRKRTIRKRIALSAASLALIAIGATGMQLATCNGGTPQPTATSPQVTASPRPTSPNQSASPSATTSASPTSGTTQPTTSSSAPNEPSSSAPATTADPHQVVKAAWLTPAQLPFADTFRWKARPATGHPLTATVFYLPNDTALQALTICGDPSNLLERTTGAQGTQYFATPNASGNAASQFVFFFSDAGSAQQTFTWLQSLYGPTCLPGSGMTVTKTAGDGLTSATWLSRKGSTGPVDVAPYNREYFVLRGSTIAYVSISSTTNLPATYDDATQLSTIAAHLCVYGGPCT